MKKWKKMCPVVIYFRSYRMKHHEFKSISLEEMSYFVLNLLRDEYRTGTYFLATKKARTVCVYKPRAAVIIIIVVVVVRLLL